MRWQSLVSKAIANTSTRQEHVKHDDSHTCFFTCDNGARARTSALAAYAHRVTGIQRREDGVWCWVLRD